MRLKKTNHYTYTWTIGPERYGIFPYEYEVRRSDGRVWNRGTFSVWGAKWGVRRFIRNSEKGARLSRFSGEA